MLRKKVFIFVLTGWISLFMLYSQDSPGKSFLWEIKSDKAKGNSYLFGSVHLLKKEHYPLKKSIEDSFNKCDVLVLEIDLSGDKIWEAGISLLQKGRYQGDDNLKNHISAETYRLVMEKAKSLDLDIQWLNGFKPWMAGLNLMETKLMKMGFMPLEGIDMYFLRKANEAKKEIQGLETIEFQLSLFENFSKAEEEKFLLSMILEVDQLEKEMDKLIPAWLSGDTEALEKTSTENIQEKPELMAFYKKLNDDRNVRMVDKIISYLDTGKTYFIVVGALHMVGKNGIVQLLVNKGYKVNQL